MTIHDLQKLFFEFLHDEVTIPPVTRLSIKGWIEERKVTYQLYKRKFSPIYINKLSEREFHHFLTSRGNKSWTNLPRGCKRVTANMDSLRDSIVHIQDENIDMGQRLNDVIKGGNKYVKGFGKNLVTGLLHVFDWGKYGVWNNRSQVVLDGLGRLPNLSYNFAESYMKFNDELKKMASEIKTDLVYLDGFLWWLDHNNKITLSRISLKRREKKTTRIKTKYEKWSCKVQALVKADKLENALLECTKAIEENLSCVNAYICRGTIYALLGLNRHALNDFIIATDIDSKEAEAHFGCGGAYAALDDNENAIEEFRIAARMGHKVAQDHLASNGIDW